MVKSKEVRKLESCKNIIFVICPTPFQDFDILAIGHKPTLEAYKKANPYYHLIHKSRFGGVPILILDTADKISDAKNIVEKYTKDCRDEMPGV